MPLKIAVCIALTIFLLAAPASALGANVVTPSSVTGSTTVPAGRSTTLRLSCPATAVALNAALTQRGAGVSVRRSIPGSGSGDWSFHLTATDGARRRGVQAVLRCVRLKLPAEVSGTRLVVSTRLPASVAVPAGSSTPVQVGCARGFAATGYGLDRGASRDVTIAAAVPGPRGWEFRLENTGTAPARARLSVRCLKRLVSTRRGGVATQMSFRVTQREFSNRVGPGAGSRFSHSCGQNEFSTATGSLVEPADDIELSGSHPNRSRGGHWAFAHARTGDQVRSSLVCLSRRTRFG